MRSWLIFSFIAFMALALFPLAGCAKENDATAIYEPIVVHTDDSAVMLQVEVARTSEELAKGLMYRKSLDPQKGMLFILPEIRQASFWMKNTLIPLDLIFITDKGMIAHIHKMAMPLDESPLPSLYPVKAVLEIGGGEASRQGIKIGHRIETKLLQQE